MMNVNAYDDDCECFCCSLWMLFLLILLLNGRLILIVHPLYIPSWLTRNCPRRPQKKGQNKHCVCVCVLQRMHREREEMINQMPLYYQDEDGNQVSMWLHTIYIHTHVCVSVRVSVLVCACVCVCVYVCVCVFEVPEQNNVFVFGQTRFTRFDAHTNTKHTHTYTHAQNHS
jgi:hypothetical protein